VLSSGEFPQKDFPFRKERKRKQSAAGPELSLFSFTIWASEEMLMLVVKSCLLKERKPKEKSTH